MEFKIVIYKTMCNAKLESAWLEMEKEDKNLSPFLYYEYMKNIFRQTQRYTLALSPFIACVEEVENGAIVMIAPLKKDVVERNVKMLGDIKGCGCTDFIFSHRLTDSDRHKCVELLLKQFGKLKLRRVKSESIVSQCVERCFVSPMPSKQMCVRLVFGGDVDGYVESLSHSVRQNLRTAYNRMRRDGVEYELRIWMPGTPIDNDTWQELMRTYLDRLLGKYKTVRFGSVFYKFYKTVFYRYIAHDSKSLYELGNAFHAVLLNNGKLMAFMSGYADHNETKLVIPRLAINNEYKFYSPGYVLILETMRKLSASSNFREIDLSRGTERYKLDLGGLTYYTFSWIRLRRISASIGMVTY